ncbi:MAG TPA: C-GCAxxG-C-C family protein [Candidatus Anoxymicrobiaceae bacterium]
MGKTEPLEERLDRLASRAGDCLELYSSCAQGTLLALQEEFGLGDARTLKAATAMPGIAHRGETCGAVVGALMALGLAFGREKPDDYTALVKTIGSARRLCAGFEEEFGGCMCRDVQVHLFGRSFDLADPAEIIEFAKAGAAKKCRVPAEYAVRAAGRLIIEGQL